MIQEIRPKIDYDQPQVVSSILIPHLERKYRLSRVPLDGTSKLLKGSAYISKECERNWQGEQKHQKQ